MRVIIAARLSQLGKGQTGIDSQDEDAREWSEDNGHEVVDVAADHKSGTVPPWQRPALKPWVTDPALMARYDAIVAAKQDRLSRAGWRDETDIRRWAEDHGKVLFIVDKNMMWPPADEDDVGRWNDGAEAARREWVSISKRYKRMHRRLRSNGGYGGRPPFGCLVTGEEKHKQLIPSDEGRLLVPEIYRRIAGQSEAVTGPQTITAVAEWLAVETGRPWWPRTVSDLVKNPVYRGVQMSEDRTTVTYKWAGIVDDDLWADANKSLAGRAKRGTHVSESSALSGVLRCCKCSAPMYKITCGTGNQPRTAFYRCAGLGPLRKSTCKNMIRLADADALVDEVMSQLDRPVIEWRRVKGTNHKAAIQAVEHALVDFQALGLDEDAEDAERASLRAEKRRLLALPNVPDSWEATETGETYAAQWAALAPAARRAWLKQHAPRLYAGKPGMDARMFADEADEDVTMTGERATYHMGHGLVLSVIWTVDEDAA